MTSEYRYAEGKIKSFHSDYVCECICDQCKWNGVPDQKIVIVYLGIRPVNEPGFIHKFETCDYSDDGNKQIHEHKFDPKLIEQLVDSSYDRNKVSSL